MSQTTSPIRLLAAGWQTRAQTTCIALTRRWQALSMRDDAVDGDAMLLVSLSRAFFLFLFLLALI